MGGDVIASEIIGDDATARESRTVCSCSAIDRPNVMPPMSCARAVAG